MQGGRRQVGQSGDGDNESMTRLPTTHHVLYHSLYLLLSLSAHIPLITLLAGNCIGCHSVAALPYSCVPPPSTRQHHQSASTRLSNTSHWPGHYDLATQPGPRGPARDLPTSRAIGSCVGSADVPPSQYFCRERRPTLASAVSVLL